MSSESFVTLATNDGYALGALVLAESIRKSGSTKRLTIMTSKNISDSIRKILEDKFDELVLVDELNSNDDEHLNLLSRPELGVTFTKLNCWLLTQFSKCVFLDADCLVLKNIDDLFEREELSAAPDAGWPDCFNSGVFVFRPSKETYRRLMLFASQRGASFDGGDQGLLNEFFSDWRTSNIDRHLSFTYNVTSNAFYSYLPAITRFRNDVRVVHFAGSMKPWQLTYNTDNEQLSGQSGQENEIQRGFLLAWWRLMYNDLLPLLTGGQKLNRSNDEVDGDDDQSRSRKTIQLNTFTSISNESASSNDDALRSGSAAHRRAWEAGCIDYQGRDSFSNIQEQLEKNLVQQTSTYHPSNLRQTSVDDQDSSNNDSSQKQ